MPILGNKIELIEAPTYILVLLLLNEYYNTLYPILLWIPRRTAALLIYPTIYPFDFFIPIPIPRRAHCYDLITLSDVSNQ